jgi:hypothetical protein
LIYEFKVKIPKKKMICKVNYKVVINIRFLLYQSIVPKIFMVNALLNIGYLLKS